MDAVKATPCPACGYVVDDATALTTQDGESASCVHEGGPTPDAGDISICLRCSWITIFTGNELETRPMTEAESVLINTDPTVIKMIRTMNRYYGANPAARP